MKYFLSFLSSICILSSYGQTFKSGALLAQGSDPVNFEMTMFLSDTKFLMIDPIVDTIEYKVLSKGANNAYKLSDGARECSLTVLYYETPPVKAKGKLYHYWIVFESLAGRFTYFCEKAP